MTKEQIRDKCCGSLIGRAVGDALGYAVKFMSLSSILKQYGERSITKYELNNKGIAEFSDDTQMSLFMAEVQLFAVAYGVFNETEIMPYISIAYEHWYCTQTSLPLRMKGSWLSHVRNLWSRHAPGNLCMPALKSISKYGS